MFPTCTEFLGRHASAISSYDRSRSVYPCMMVAIMISSAPVRRTRASSPAFTVDGEPTIWEEIQARQSRDCTNIKEYLQPRKAGPRKVVFAGWKREADPFYFWGRPMTRRKKQVSALRGTAVAWDQASEERFSEITSGTSRWQQGLIASCKDSSNEATAEGEERQASKFARLG